MNRLLPSLILIGLSALIVIGCKINQAMEKVAPEALAGSVAAIPAPVVSVEECTNDCFDGVDLNTRTSLVLRVTAAAITHGVRSDGRTNQVTGLQLVTNDTLADGFKWPWPVFTNVAAIQPVIEGDRMVLFRCEIPLPWAGRMYFRAHIFTNS